MRQQISCLPLLAALVLLGCATPGPGDARTGEAAALVEVTPEGDPLIDGERRPPSHLVERLRAADAPPAPVVRLPHGVPPERLWPLWTRLAEQLPETATGAMRLELPLAEAGDAYRTFAEPPPVIVVAPDAIRVGSRGAAPLPLGSIDELVAVAANFVSRDPEACFVLIVEEGAGTQRLAAAEERLRRGHAKHLYRLDGAGLRPLAGPS